MTKLCITISGSHGSGTSTIGKALAKSLNLKYLSAGDIFREFAKRRGIDIAEFINIVEGNQFLKDELDARMKDEGKKGGIVLEGRITGWIVGDVANLRIMLKAPLDVRIKRISKRNGLSVEKAKTQTENREVEERTWFQKQYGIDVEDYSIYDIILDTSIFSITKVLDIITTAFDT